MLPDPVVAPRYPATNPTATLRVPVVLLTSALSPIAVLLLPVVLAESALRPAAVLLLPDVVEGSALIPRPVLPPNPVVVRFPAFCPRNVFSVPKLCRNSDPFFVMFPAVAVDGSRSRFPVLIV